MILQNNIWFLLAFILLIILLLFEIITHWKKDRITSYRFMINVVGLSLIILGNFVDARFTFLGFTLILSSTLLRRLLNNKNKKTQ